MGLKNMVEAMVRINVSIAITVPKIPITPSNCLTSSMIEFKSKFKLKQ